MSVKTEEILVSMVVGSMLAFAIVGLIFSIAEVFVPTDFEQHIQDRIKAADSMAITAQEKAVRVRTEGGVE
jgi:hypothetical protein